MEKDEKQTGRKRRHHLRVPVFPDEKEEIERQARQAGLSVARYLREVGQGYEIKGITDYERVRELARINGDLGRLGGLLKLWLTDDAKLEEMAPERMPVIIRGVLAKIEANQEELSGIIRKVLRSRQDFSG